MLQSRFSIRQFWLTELSILVHSSMRNAPYIHPGHSSIIELWQTFSNVTGPRPTDGTTRKRHRTVHEVTASTLYKQNN